MPTEMNHDEDNALRDFLLNALVVMAILIVCFLSGLGLALLLTVWVDL